MLLDTIYSDYWAIQDWRKWSDHLIHQQENPAWWVIQLSLAATPADAMTVLNDYLASVLYSDETNHKDIVLGYLFLAYQEQRFSIQQFLARAWQETESAEDIGTVTNDGILELYNGLTASGSTDYQSKIITERVVALFRQCADLAARDLGVINSYVDSAL